MSIVTRRVPQIFACTRIQPGLQVMVQVSPVEAMDTSHDDSFLQRVNRAVNGRIERAFDWLGRSIARRPWMYIATAVLCVAAV